MKSFYHYLTMTFNCPKLALTFHSLPSKILVSSIWVHNTNAYFTTTNLSVWRTDAQNIKVLWKKHRTAIPEIQIWHAELPESSSMG